jgi:hypothetical protein
MLPGQLVNVLNVPMHFSTSNPRDRNGSVSSTSSELRTMNPEDKYLNPRPAPKPVLPRLNTVVPQQSAPNLESSPYSQSPTVHRVSHGRNASLPASAISLRSFRLPRKASMDVRGRSASPSHGVTGLRAAFRHLTPMKANSSEGTISRGRAGYPASHRELLSLDQARRSDRAASDRLEKATPRSSSEHSIRSETSTPTIDESLRQAQFTTLALWQSLEELDKPEEGFRVSSFQKHRRQKSQSREPSPLHTSLLSPEQPETKTIMEEASCEQYQPMETLREVVSAQNTPILPSAGTPTSTNDNVGTDGPSTSSDKRLPIIPNTPSLASSLREHSQTSQRAASKGATEHPSSPPIFTTTNEYPSSTDRSHFSHWTATTTSSFSSSQWSSVFLEGKSPSFMQDTAPSSQPTSPWEMASARSSHDSVRARESSSALDADRMPSVISSSTISSYDNTSPSSPTSEISDTAHTMKGEPTSLQKRYGMMLGDFQGYKLPVGAQASESTTKTHLPYLADGRSQNTFSSSIKATTEEFSPSTSMQQLLAELSYLGDMIQE